ncbi:MAG: HemK family protein methyltransferase, partial [Bacilli bacterium]
NGFASLVDVGTGSGVIGLTLKKELPNLKVTLADISNTAIELAKENAKLLQLDAMICNSDMLTNIIKKGETFDVLISNPPYIAEEEPIMDIVKNNEPLLALYGGEKGLKYYDIILSQAKQVLNRKGLIAFEIGAGQARDICQLANKYFKGSRNEIKKDLQGRDRMFFLFYNLND